MKNVIVGMLVCCAAALTLNAQDAEGRKGLSEKDYNKRQAVIEKYDSDGDGVLDKGEQKNLSRKDKKTLAKTGGVGTAGKAPKGVTGDVKPPEDRDEDSDRDGKMEHEDYKDSDRHGEEEHEHDEDHDGDDDDGKPEKSEKAAKGAKGGKGKGGKK